MRVMALGMEAGTRRPVLLLQEASGDHRLLPVWIGIAEANAITVEQHRVSLPRPITHQLIVNVMDAFGRHLEGCESFRVTLSGDHAARAGVVGVVLAE
jgi:bifunctional DNase/RNase